MSELLNACAGCLLALEICACGYDSDAPRTATVLRPGTRLASADRRHEYVLGSNLGEGAFSVTYLAWDVRANKRVAIKEFLPQELAGRVSGSTLVRPKSDANRAYFEHGLARFINETQALSQFDHDNIVGVDAHFEANDTAYLVMPYYDAVTLGKYVDRNGPMTPEVALSVILAVLDGLSHVHATKLEGRRWTHRDVQPDNILLRSDSNPLLIDFGAARVEALNEKRALSVLATPGFAPKEQHVPNDQNDGPWVDVYGAAATLYFALTGKEPVDARIREDEIVERKRPDPLEPPAALNKDVSPQLSRAVMRGMALDFHHRPADAAAFANVLKRSGPTFDDATYAVLGLLRGRWARRLAMVAGVVVMACLVVANLQLRQDKRDAYNAYRTENRELKEEGDKLRTKLRTYQSKAAVTAATAEEITARADEEKTQLTAQIATAQQDAQNAQRDAQDAQRDAQKEIRAAAARAVEAAKRTRAEEFLSGARSLTVRSSASGLVRRFALTLAAGPSSVQASGVSLTVDASDSTEAGRAVSSGASVKVFLAVVNQRTNEQVTSGWTGVQTVSSTGQSQINIPGALTINKRLPCSVDDIVADNCRVWVIAGGASTTTTGSGDYMWIRP